MAESVPKLTWQEKLAKGTEYKNNGNVLYGEKQYKPAMKKYHQAMLYVRAVESTSDGVNGISQLMQGPQPPTLTPAAKEDVLKLKIACLNNIAACMLQIDEPNLRRVVEQCQQVIELAPSNVKAMFRMAQAYYRLNEIEKALDILHKASKLTAGAEDKKIRQLIKSCKEREKEEDEKVKMRYKNMFEKV